MALFGSVWKYINGRATVGQRTPLEKELPYPKRTDGDQQLTLLLETKLFEGLRATTSAGTIERYFSAALTGLSATASAGLAVGRAEQYDYLDSFTGTNGDALTGHTPDVYTQFGTYTTCFDPSTTGEPNIQSNMLRGISGGEYFADIGEPYPTVDPWFVRARLYRRNTTGTTDRVNGIAFCATSSGASGGAEAFVFGWNEANDYWELVRYWGGAYSASLGTSTTDAFSGTSEYRNIEVKVTGSQYNLNITCYVNGVSVITYNETVFGLQLFPFGPGFGGDNSVDIEWMGSLSEAPKLLGYRINTGQGTLTPGNIELVGLSATVSGGLLDPTGGGAVTAALTGLSCTASQGTGMRGWQSVGSDGVKFSLLPNLKHTWNYSTDFYPGKVTSHFVYKDGSLWGAGTTGDPNADTYDQRLGLYEVSETAETTIPWVDTGTGLSDPNDLSIYSGSSFVDGNQFPRNGLEPSTTWRFNYAPMKGAIVAISRDNTIFTAFSRAHGMQWDNNFGEYHSFDFFFAPQFGEIEPTNNYNGPEFRVTRAPLLGVQSRNDQRNFLGAYPITDAEVVAFYPYEYDASKSGRMVELCGLRAITRSDPMTRSASGEAGGVLVGYAATTAQGTMTPSVDGDTQVRLTGLRAETLTYRQYLPEYHNVIPEKTDVNIVPAFRVLKDGVWSPETIASSFSGHTRSWVIEESLVVAHSGYGDVLHCVYASARPNATGLSNDFSYDVTHLGVLTIDASTRTVISNTLVSVGAITPLATPYTSGFVNQGVKSHGPERAVAKVVRLDNGTHVTQFLIRGYIAHLQWTDASPTVPTLTVKDKTGLTTAGLGAGWESLESRAGRVYHVLYALATGGSYNATAQYNDATDAASSVWTTATVTTTGSSTVSGSNSGNAGYDTYAGQGKDKTWLYGSRGNAGLGDTIEENQTIWVDFWKNQLPIFSVAAQGVVGRVGVVINPNVALVGHRLTTGTDNIGLFPLKDGDAVARLTGKRATTYTPSGYDMPTYAQFFIDEFDGTGNLTAHVADTGQMWLQNGAINYFLSGGQLYATTDAFIGHFVSAYVDAVWESNDYCVKSRFTSANQFSNDWALGAISDGIGVRVTWPLDGYWFGWNANSNTWALVKGHPFVQPPVATYDGGFSTEEFAIEVTGNSPARVRCYIDDILVIDYLDTTAPYYYSGTVAICSSNDQNQSSVFEYVNAGKHDGTANIPLGQRATLYQGILVVAGGLTGLRATTARGFLTAEVSYLTLTGLRADAYQGTLTPGNIELVGLAATTAAGTIIGTGASPVVLALTGMRAYTYAGVLELLNRELVGLRAETRMGMFTWLAESFQSLTGLNAATTLGVLTPADTITITGYAATLDAGDLSPTVSAPYYSTGLAAAARGGLLTPSVANEQAFTGQAAVTAAGTLTPSTGVETSTTGQSATASQGTVVPEVSVTLTGQRATASAGQIVPLIVVTPTGQQAVTAAGTLQVLANIALTGQACTVNFGSLGVRVDGFVTLVGVQAVGRVADLSQGMPPPDPDEALFTTKKDESLYVTDEPEETFVRVPF